MVSPDRNAELEIHLRRATMAWMVTALLALALAATPARAQDSAALAAAHANEKPSLRLSFGAGVAGRWAAGAGDPVLPIEVSLTRAQVLSLSAGGVLTTDGVAHAYGELGLYTGISLGVGGGYGAYQSPARSAS
jgi:hypothetical protein